MINYCSTGKKSFQTESIAEEALLSAWTMYNYPPDKGPIAIYVCDECGTYHFTSKGTMNPKLSAMLADGTLTRQKDANAWLDKINKRGKYKK